MSDRILPTGHGLMPIIRVILRDVGVDASQIELLARRTDNSLGYELRIAIMWFYVLVLILGQIDVILATSRIVSWSLHLGCGDSALCRWRGARALVIRRCWSDRLLRCLVARGHTSLAKS